MKYLDEQVLVSDYKEMKFSESDAALIWFAIPATLIVAAVVWWIFR